MVSPAGLVAKDKVTLWKVRVCGSDGEWTGNNDTMCKGEENCVQVLTVAS